jgi:adenylate cyclase
MPILPKKYVMEKEYPLERKTVWKLLSDTDRLNRFIGLFPVKFNDVTKKKGDIFYRDALAKVGGIIPLRWKEYPFQWIENEYYAVERHYHDGPLKHFVGGVELFDFNDNHGQRGTKVRLFAEFTARNVFGIAAIPVTGLTSMKNTMKYLDEFLERYDGNQTYTPIKNSKPKVNFDELRRKEIIVQDYPINPEYIRLLHRYLIEKSDHEVVEMKPAIMAAQWGVNSDEVVRLLLYATKAGVLNLSWNLVCPNCRVSKVEYSSLSLLKEQFHCDLCGINYDANFDKYVELYFSVHPSIRRAYAQPYCIGGPMITPHIKVQKVIEKGKTQELKIPISNASLRLRVLEKNHLITIKQSSKFQKSINIHYRDAGWTESTFELGSTTNTIGISNSSSTDIVLVVEEIEWNNDTVTASKVTAMQEFRDLFSSEVLSPGQQVGIENVTILFSDLLGSTSLYESVGDAKAYGQVRRHFEFLTHWISRNSGSVVKTIGDAVMAVFHLPEDGLKAAIDIQKHVAEFNEEGSDEIVLKIGLYRGPAIAVNSNDLLDYFGRTVNIAARIQGQSHGDDIVFSTGYLDIEKIHSILDTEKVQIQSFRAELKGIAGNVDLIRLDMKTFKSKPDA